MKRLAIVRNARIFMAAPITRTHETIRGLLVGQKMLLLRRSGDNEDILKGKLLLVKREV